MQIFLNPVSFWIKNIEEGTQKYFFFFFKSFQLHPTLLL